MTEARAGVISSVPMAVCAGAIGEVSECAKSGRMIQP